MPRTLTLTAHEAIRNWVRYRNGQPAIATERDQLGSPHARLSLNFSPHREHEAEVCLPDTISPCSWTAWLAEFDRQHLALEVPDDDDDDVRDTDIRFITRHTRH